MEHSSLLRSLADDELLRRVGALVAKSHRNEAEIVAHLAEVDERRLHLGQAFPSVFAYCTQSLHFSESEAYLRIGAARASREHPMLLEMLADGRLHLSAIVRLAPHLSIDNREAVLRRAVHLSRREIDELVAELSPRPDAPALVRKLPQRIAERNALPDSAPSLAERGVASPPHSTADGGATAHPETLPKVAGAVTGPATPASTALCQAPGALRLVPDTVAPHPTSVPSRPRRHDAVEPTAPGRYKVQFTAGAAFVEKLERLREFLVDAPGGNDLAAIIEQAVTEKLERLEARRFGQAKRRRPAETQRTPQRPASSKPRPASRHVPAAVRRAVYERAGGRCTFTDERGRRCEARARLEIHHRHPWAYAGRHETPSLTLLCRAHHALVTEADFGVWKGSRSLLPGPGQAAGSTLDGRAP